MGATERDVRSRSGRPSSASGRRTAWLTTEGVTLSRPAAAAKVPASTTASTTVSRSQDSIRPALMHARYRVSRTT